MIKHNQWWINGQWMVYDGYLWLTTVIMVLNTMLYSGWLVYGFASWLMVRKKWEKITNLLTIPIMAAGSGAAGFCWPWWSAHLIFTLVIKIAIITISRSRPIPPTQSRSPDTDQPPWTIHSLGLPPHWGWRIYTPCVSRRYLHRKRWGTGLPQSASSIMVNHRELAGRKSSIRDRYVIRWEVRP